MKIEIKDGWTGQTMFTEEAETLRDAVVRLVANRANLYGADLYGANLYGANLYGANLYRANLYRANLYGANLYRANLYGANLDSANLYRANLDSANLYRANLYRANLYGANLDSANLYRANLDSANLYRANLYRANLDSANLPSPTAILLAAWGDLSQQLCADLMMFDAANHPDPEAFERWAKGGGCPYEDTRVGRAANFNEKREYWGQGVTCRPYDLMVRVLTEKCPGWTEEQRVEFMKRLEK